MSNFKFVLQVFLIWRLLLFTPLLFQQIPLNQFLIFPWTNFDGSHFISIAFNGYTFDGRFFPLYPILIKLGSLPFNFYEAYNFIDAYIYVGLFISNLFFLLSLMLLYKMVKNNYSEQIARLSVVSLLIFPTSFFFGGIYSESLFLFLSLLTFYFSQKKQWGMASITALLLSVTRFVGIFILLPLIYEFIVKEKANRLKSISLFFIPSGLIAFSIFCYYKWGDALYFIKAQGQLGNSRSVDSIITPLQTVYRYLRILASLPYKQYDFWIALLELSVFLFVSILIYIGWKKKLNRSFFIFALISFLIPVSSGTFTGLPRYVITIFPLFITLALINNRIFKFAYAIISTALLFVLLMLFSRGYFVA